MKELIFTAVCAFHDGEFAHFSLDNLSECGISKNSLAKTLKDLCTEGRLINRTEQGFYSRYEIPNKIECPDFVFNKHLTVGQKEFLLECYNTLPTYEPRAARQLALDLGRGDDYKRESRNLTNIKGFGWTAFDYLSRAEMITKEISHPKYELVKTIKGYQIDSEPTAKEHRDMSHSERIKAYRDDSGLAKGLISKIKDSSRRKGYRLEVSVTEDDIRTQLEEQEYKDYYTGLPLSDKCSEISVDRIDNELGYIPGNICFTCWEVNRMKRDMEIDKFIELCSQVANHFNKK